MDSDNLTTPLQHEYTDPTVERDVARLREWLSNLPLMDVAETVRLVLRALEALNEQKLDPQLRFDSLEAYRVTAQRLFQTVDPLHLRQLALGKAQRQEAIDGVADVFPGIAGGYKLIVKELLRKADAGSIDPMFGKVLNRALEQLSYALLDSYRFYREPPPLLISESNTLYRLARRHGLLGVSVEPDDAAQAPATTAMLFHTSMLLSLTDPTRLAEGEVGLLFDVLMQHADQCRIIPGNSWEGSGEGLFLVDLPGGGVPTSCARLIPPVDVPDAHLLDATAALDAIRAKLAKTPARVRMQSPEAMLLRRLLPEEAASQRRREQRHKDDRYVAMLLGLESIHSWMHSFSGRRTEQMPASAGTLSECRVLDSSNSGMRLYWDKGGVGDARVGDLLGILENDAERQLLRLAIIRSIRVYREGGMETGVQLLSGGLGAVSCSLPGQPGVEAVPALFMSANEAQHVAATLIALKGLYEQGRAISIDAGDQQFDVHAGRRVFDSPVFDRFEFST